MGMPKYHNAECKLFEDVFKTTEQAITTFKMAQKIYMYLGPLRLLLKAETMPEIMELDSKIEERRDTLIYFFNMSKVVKPLHQLLGLGQRFSEEQIQIACGLLDTNCYEIKWDRGIARGLYVQAAMINHNCAPNCRKYFDAQRTMHVITCCDIEAGQELSVSYTNPLLCTPMRRVCILKLMTRVLIFQNVLKICSRPFCSKPNVSNVHVQDVKILKNLEQVFQL